MKDTGKAQFNASSESVVIKDDAEKFDDGCLPQLKRTPKHTWAVLTAEVCERFSYYGIKAVLVIYLTQALGMTASLGKAHYHGFSMVSYFTGVLGAMMADSFLGKFKTILWSLVVYSIAEICLTLTTIPSIGQGASAGPLIGLYITAIACGNIKPCMAAFGGDQFNQKDSGIISLFFSLFYMSVNVGAGLTMIFLPMMRTDIKCYGGDCYPVVYGVCTIVIILATISFALGSPWYTKKEPEGNMMIRVFKIIGHAISRKREGTGEKYQHWLYYAQDRYEKAEIDDVRSLLKVLVMYIPLPVFWALFHQQGSSWTLQAEQMDGDLGAAGSIRADQMQFLNAVLVLILIPLFDYVLYPLLERCQLPLSPLKRMVGGMVLASVAFCITGFMQIKIQDVSSPPPLPPVMRTSVDFINVSPCQLLQIQPDDFSKIALPYGTHTSHSIGQSGNLTFDIKGTGCFVKGDSYRNDVKIMLKSGQRVSVLLDIDDNGKVTAKTMIHEFPKVSVTTAQTRIRLLYIPSNLTEDTITLTYVHELDQGKNIVLNNYTSYNKTHLFLPADEYSLHVKNNKGEEYPVSFSSKNFKLGTFGAYTITLKRPMQEKSTKKLVAHLYEDVPSSSVHRIWQLPQYIVITGGEVMFSVTGLEFAYSQDDFIRITNTPLGMIPLLLIVTFNRKKAPSSMKSVLQACWLLTTAFGDLIVVILSLAKPVDGVEKEMFLYGAIMLIVAFIFSIMSYFYTYSDFSGNTPAIPLDEKPETEDKLTKADSTTHL